jgi:glyoxylase-like metal-dependent hydrolase (beta-lactamase superfamily II)
VKVHVLGCAGGIGGRERFTTCLRIDDDVTLDAGTGLCSLGIDELTLIDHVFLTHFHLDHVAGLALLADAVQGRRRAPITVYGSAEVIASLKTHLFNWQLWPDFAMIPDRDTPVLRWSVLEAGASVDLGGRIFTPHRVNHTQGSVAYWVHNGCGGLLFSGDMTTTPALWQAFATEKKLRKVIVDCSFPNAEADIAARSLHFCPRSLIEDIGGMPQDTEFLIYHLKPGQEDLIMRELRDAGTGRTFAALACGDRFVI